MGKACEKFSTPVTGGNVSFYNQSKIGNDEVPVFPTPTIGMMGIVENKNNITSLAFKNSGDHIFLIGSSQNDISSSEYLYSYHNIKNSPAPYFNLDEEYNMQQVIKSLISEKVVESVHDVSDGGLFIALLESGITNGLGFDVTTDEEIRTDAFLYGESQSRVIVSVNEESLDTFLTILSDTDVDFTNVGQVTAGEILVDGNSFGSVKE